MVAWASRIGGLACLLAFVALPTHASARPKPATPDLIEKAAQQRKIDRDTATLYLAYALRRPAKLPAAYRSMTPWDGTLPLLRVRQAVRRMKPGPKRDRAQEVLAPEKPPGGGPDCGGNAVTSASTTSSTHFYVEYSSIGGGLGISDYVASLEEGWTTEVTSFGWAAPPLLSTPAGSRYHVQIDTLQSGLYGYVSSSGTYAGSVGNNPNTAWNEGDAFASCMVLNRDYSGFPSSPQNSLDATTAHEFNHSLQFGYGGLSGANTPDDVFVEGGATWMEDEVQDASNDNYFYLWPVFADSMGDYDNSPYEYWITFRGLTERYGTGTAGGGEQVMQDFWEQTSQNTGNNLGAMQTALANKGTTLAAAYHAYAIAVKFNKACGGGYSYPYCFQEGPGYVSAAGATPVHHTISSVGGSTSNAQVEDNFALNWVQLPSSASAYDVTLENTSAGGQLRATVACDTGSSLSLQALPAVVGAGATTTLSGFNPSGCAGSPVAVITNESKTADNPSSSSLRSYQVRTAGAPLPNHTLNVSKAGSGSGTVTSNPGGINCGGDCTQDYAQGTSVTLTAVAAAGSRFGSWSGDCSGTSTTCNVTMSSAKSATANFIAQHQLSVSKTGSGTVTSNPGGINCGGTCSALFDQGTTVTLNASPAAGWSFTGWSGAGCSGTASCVVTMDAAKSVSATFTQNPPGTFALTVTRNGSGTVTSTPGIDCGGDCSQTYNDGTVVTLSAAPAEGWSFSGWSGACSGTGSCQLTMSADRNVTATFTENPPSGGGGEAPGETPPGDGTPTTTITSPVVTTRLDSIRPSLVSLRLSATAFRAALAGPSARSAAPVGTRVTWVLSEPARVLFRVEQARPGRRVGGRCVPVTAANRNRTPCTRFVLMRGSFSRNGVSGANAMRFLGRLAGRRLATGRYRLTATASDVAGNRSLVRRVSFRIVP